MFGSLQEIWLVDFEFNNLKVSGRSPFVWSPVNCEAVGWCGSGTRVVRAASFRWGRIRCSSLIIRRPNGTVIALGWQLPARILDLYAEFRCLTSGLERPCGSGLLGAMSYFGLDGINIAEKDAMRRLVDAGRAVEGQKRAHFGLLPDGRGLTRPIACPVMLPQIDFPRALIRGRYMAAAARMESAGVPIDVPALARIGCNGIVQERLIARIDKDFRRL